MGVASISEYVALLNEEQQQYILAFLEFMNTEYPQLTNKISFSMPMWFLGKKMKDGYVAISAAKNHFSDEKFVERLAETLPACKKGKRCIQSSAGYPSMDIIKLFTSIVRGQLYNTKRKQR